MSNLKKFNRVVSIRGFDSPLLISGLRIAFRIERSPFDALGRCQMDIINAKIKEQGEILFKRGQRFILEAGYEGSISAMFLGTIQNVVHFKQGNDTVTRVWAGDFIEPFEAEVNITMRNPVNLVNILEEIANQVGLSVVQYEIDPINVVGAQTFTGPLSFILNMLAESFNFIWILKDNALHIVSELGSTANIFEINASTGLLESPILTHKGLNVKMLLEPSIKPSDIMIITDGGVVLSQSNLEYRDALAEGNTQRQVAYTVIHSGDTHSDLWVTEVEGVALSGT